MSGLGVDLLDFERGVRIRSVDLLDFDRGGVRVKGGPVTKWGGGTFNTPTCVTVVRA